MPDLDRLLQQTAELAAHYLDSIDDRPVVPSIAAADLRAGLGGALPEDGEPDEAVILRLAQMCEPGLVGSAGGRYFGFVTGGHVGASLAADWLTSAWDQNSFSFVSSPATAVVEEIAAQWILEILALPADASVAFVTGCQMAHVTALAAARHAVLDRVGWDVAQQGLFGAPRIRVVTGEARHSTVDRALRLIGLGHEAVELVPVDAAGRTRPDALAAQLAGGSGPLIVVAQAGEVNTGSFDDLAAVVDTTHEHGGWLHVDGAFGIWARATEAHQHLVDGLERADSWAFDAHKWLNVPYDSGVAVCAHPGPHRAAMSLAGPYLMQTKDERDASDWTPDASRRARGVPVYAALRSLGRAGVRDMVERCCRHAQRFGEEIAKIPGAEIVNEVVLNQVLVRFGDDADTDAVLDRFQRSGVAWASGTTWQGRRAIRISVSSWATDDGDVTATVRALAAARAGG